VGCAKVLYREKLSQDEPELLVTLLGVLDCFVWLCQCGAETGSARSLNVRPISFFGTLVKVVISLNVIGAQYSTVPNEIGFTFWCTRERQDPLGEQGYGGLLATND